MSTTDESTRTLPVRALLGIPSEVLDQFMAAAYRLYQSGCYAEAEVICRGLLASDHRYWYPYSLHAATLLKLGRPREALAQVESGLKYEPGQPKLLALRADIVTAGAPRFRSRAAPRERSASLTAGLRKAA